MKYILNLNFSLKTETTQAKFARAFGSCVINKINHRTNKHQRGSALLTVMLLNLLVLLALLASYSQMLLSARTLNLQQQSEATFAAAEAALQAAEQQALTWVVSLLQNNSSCPTRACIPSLALNQIPAQMPQSWWEDPKQVAVQTKPTADQSLLGRIVIQHLQSEYNDENQWVSGYFRLSARVRSTNSSAVTVLHSTIKINRVGEQFHKLRLAWNWW